MSIETPIRLKIEQNGAVKGYVETLDFSTGVTVNGPVAHITNSGGGGGDADTLQGHPASFFAAAADVDALEDRALMWARLGVVVQTTPPASGITYAQWLSGVNGNWGWIELP